MVLHQGKPTGSVFGRRKAGNVVLSLLLKTKEQIVLHLATVKVVMARVVINPNLAIQRSLQRPCRLALSPKTPVAVQITYPAAKIIYGFSWCGLLPDEGLENLVVFLTEFVRQSTVLFPRLLNPICPIPWYWHGSP